MRSFLCSKVITGCNFFHLEIISHLEKQIICINLENTTETGKEELGLLEDTQTDFRSILSFGVQPP